MQETSNHKWFSFLFFPPLFNLHLRLSLKKMKKGEKEEEGGREEEKN